MAARPMPSNLAAVRGLTVGHWTDLGTATGCTVVLAPEGGMRAARAVIFDFDLAPGAKADRWPTADDAYGACAAAASAIAEGSVGAGTGATVGKALGPRAAMKGGVGTWAVAAGDVVVGALVVLNAVGSGVDA